MRVRAPIASLALAGRASIQALAAPTLVAIWLGAMPASTAAGNSLEVTDSRVPASDQVGVDLPLVMTIRNDAADPDALLRVRCPVANFSEKHTVDRGEGAPAMRSIRSIPVAAAGTTALTVDGFHVMLLQTRQPLAAGEKFTCAIDFQKAGTIETEVNVRNRP
jgi:copper(I)-binding protein